MATDDESNTNNKTELKLVMEVLQAWDEADEATRQEALAYLRAATSERPH